jgi:cytochrome d ubiquinol oxidase subunit II
METLAVLQHIWFILIGVLLAGYSILDGFDLGVGALMPFLAKNQTEKQLLYNAIGPFWDGNEVWLLTGGGALFAAFPFAYATVFSGFYLALMLLLFALIFRAVSLEFWSYDENRRGLWEWTFVIGSVLPSLLFGVALGNVMVGIPLNAQTDFTGNFFTLLRPYPLAVGLLGLSAILLQGSTYAAMKTEGAIQTRARKLTQTLWLAFIILLGLSFVAGVIYTPEILTNWLAWLAAAVVLVAWFLLKISVGQKQDGRAFSLAAIIFLGLWGIVGAIHFPNLVKASNDPKLSLTLFNASSTQLTLTVMLIIALIGMPIVVGYTIYVYRVFKGKVKLS